MAKVSKARLAAAEKPTFSLNEIYLAEASFLDCSIITDLPPHGGLVPAARFDIPHLLLRPSFDIAQRQVYYQLELRVVAQDEQQQPTGATGNFRLHFGFQVNNILDYATTMPNVEGPVPVADLMIMLGGVAYSTTRGMLLGKTAGTPLSNFALPLRSPQDIFYESLDVLMQQHEAPKRKRPTAKSKSKTS